MQALTLDGVKIRSPKDLGFEDYDLTKSGRVISGKMTMEIIAKKMKFTFKYPVMSGTEFEALMTIFRNGGPFYTFVYMDTFCVQKSVKVYKGAIKRQQFRTDGVWYWKDVAFDLIEQ